MKVEHVLKIKTERNENNMPPEEVYIDPQNIPDSVYELGCRILNSRIRAAFENPAVKADYERWKAERSKKDV